MPSNRVRQPIELSPSDAVALISPTATIAVGAMSAEPTHLTRALGNTASGSQVDCVIAGILLSGSPLLHAPGVRIRTWFAPKRSESQKADIEYLPFSWYQGFQFLRAQEIDAALIMVSPPDREGNHSLGISVGLTRTLVKRAKLVIAEVNPHMPRTWGDSLVHRSSLDVLVKSNSPLRPFPVTEARAVDRTVAANIAALIPDSCALQVGIGTIPDQVQEQLATNGARDITVLSLLTDGFRALATSGGKRDRGHRACVSEILGSRELYRWADGNRDVFMTEASNTHSPLRSGGKRPFVAVNSALEVDLFGQANLDWRDGSQTGGVGGSLDFAVRASYVGGRYLLGLRSTNSDGRSRIVSRLAPGPVSITRTLSADVATEFGVAELGGRSVNERARALIQVAHPAHRPALRQAWARQQLLSDGDA